jgi:hypothetical protein
LRIDYLETLENVCMQWRSLARMATKGFYNKKENSCWDCHLCLFWEAHVLTKKIILKTHQVLKWHKSCSCVFKLFANPNYKVSALLDTKIGFSFVKGL